MPQTLPSVKPTLVIVESPAKCNKIESFLGPGYKCIATFGHIQELKDLKDVDIANNFTPSFTPSASKSQQIGKLRKAIRESSEVLLATDDDREGEGIAWHICSLFKLPFTTKRIIFHEITKPAILQAVRNPVSLNMNLVSAQQSRQILDLIVGFKLSPILWKHITQKSARGLSAGRCQTPALRIIYDNHQDIMSSPGKKVYNTVGYFTDRTIQFSLQKHHDSEETMEDFLTKAVNFDHKFTCSKPKQTTKNPPTPYTTSAIQQAASNEMHISPKDTMRILQTLYEAGYITYMRTDSTTYSKEFIDTVKPFVTEKWGAKYLHDDVERLSLRSSDQKGSKQKKSKKEKKDENAQEAHEAIRPTNILTLTVDDAMQNKEKKMYEMIWRNTTESCMSPALFNSITAKFTAPEETEYRCSEEDVVFLGWKIVKGLPKTDGVSVYNYLLSLKQGTVMEYIKIASKVTLKDLKTHYTEAKLVQLLEQKGIGRPSTFSSLVDRIQEREYVKKENVKGKKIKCVDFVLEGEELEETVNEREFGNEKNKLVIQPLGKLVLEFLLQHFNSFFEYEYTKNMEDELDFIAKGDKVGHELCRECYEQIETQSKPLRGEDKLNIRIDENHTYVVGKHGPVIKCVISGKTTFKSVKKDIDIDKLRGGELTLEDIQQETVIAGNVLGKYEGNDMILKKGQYGLYVTWGTNNKSLASIGKDEADITLDDVVKFITTNTTIIRQLTKDLSLRKGKYGDYIYYQTSRMKKPQFLKLNGFKSNAKTCKEDELISWIKETYKLK
jgi:DNA topoisomerase-1